MPAGKENNFGGVLKITEKIPEDFTFRTKFLEDVLICQNRDLSKIDISKQELEAKESLQLFINISLNSDAMIKTKTVRDKEIITIQTKSSQLSNNLEKNNRRGIKNCLIKLLDAIEKVRHSVNDQRIDRAYRELSRDQNLKTTFLYKISELINELEYELSFKKPISDEIKEEIYDNLTILYDCCSLATTYIDSGKYDNQFIEKLIEDLAALWFAYTDLSPNSKHSVKPKFMPEAVFGRSNREYHPFFEWISSVIEAVNISIKNKINLKIAEGYQIKPRNKVITYPSMDTVEKILKDMKQQNVKNRKIDL